MFHAKIWITQTKVATTASAATLGTCWTGFITFLMPNPVALINKSWNVLSFVEAYLHVWHPLLTFFTPLARIRDLGGAIMLEFAGFKTRVT
jgi:hypothetical protein